MLRTGLTAIVVALVFTFQGLASETVYVTPYGHKYHLAGCSALTKSGYAIDLDEAIAKGYGPCKICHPPGATPATPTEAALAPLETAGWTALEGVQEVKVSKFMQKLPPQGRSGKPGKKLSEEEKAVNICKNRKDEPTEFDPRANWDSLATTPSGSADLDQNLGGVIEGYFVKGYKRQGAEGCNGHSSAKLDHDIHCYIGKTPDAPHSECIIVEITPYQAHWTEKDLKKIVGKYVRITGWLMDDSLHDDDSVVDNPSNHSAWRPSCWEIHPVTKIEVHD